MKGVATEELITNLKNITEANSSFISGKCSHLGENQMNWRPSRDSWNIHEVLSHLNALVAYYHPILLDRITHTKFQNSIDFFVSSPLGKSAWKSMKLGRANNVKRKFRAPKNQDPTLSPEIMDRNAIENFITGQTELLHLLDLAKKVNLRKVKVPISISKIVRLRLGDVLMFVVYHNERHIQQIKNLVEHRNFPKKEKQ